MYFDIQVAVRYHFHSWRGARSGECPPSAERARRHEWSAKGIHRHVNVPHEWQCLLLQCMRNVHVPLNALCGKSPTSEWDAPARIFLCPFRWIGLARHSAERERSGEYPRQRYVHAHSLCSEWPLSLKIRQGEAFTGTCTSSWMKNDTAQELLHQNKHWKWNWKK